MPLWNQIHYAPTPTETWQTGLSLSSQQSESWRLFPLIPQRPFPTLAQFTDLLQSHPCWRIFSVVEPTIWHLGDSPKYEWPIHKAQWSRLAMALHPPLPPSILKTIFSAAVLALFPEINKRGTRSCPWNPQSIKPLWDASTWHKQSDLNDNGQIIQCFVRFRGYNSTPFPKHTLVSMSSGPPGGFQQSRGLCSEEDKYMLLGKTMERCQCLPPSSNIHTRRIMRLWNTLIE